MPGLSSHQIYVIVPGYNEAKYLGSVLKKVSAKTKNIIYVDDGSRDKSVEIARQHTTHVLQHPINLGKGAAMKTGCEYAFNQLEAEAVIFMDGDDQHNPEDLEKFYQKFQEGYEAVFGIRKLNKNMPFVRRLGNASYSVLIWFLFGEYFHDIPSGFKALSKKAYQKVRWSTTDYAVESELAARVAKNKIKHCGVVIETIYHDLDRGMNILDILRLVLQIISWKFTL